MTEIPLPPSEYEAPPAPRKERGCGTTVIVVLVIAIVVVAGVVIVMMSGLGNGGTSFDEREIAYSRQDIALSPTYYSEEFSVASGEVQTSIVPDLLFEIEVRDTGSDAVSVSVHIAVYETSQTVVGDALTWGELDVYLVGAGTYTDPVSEWIDLYNYASTYTWVIWFEASGKTDVWDVEVTLTLRYNWVT